MLENIPPRKKNCLKNDDTGHAALPPFCLLDRRFVAGHLCFIGYAKRAAFSLTVPRVEAVNSQPTSDFQLIREVPPAVFVPCAWQLWSIIKRRFIVKSFNRLLDGNSLLSAS